MGNCLVTKLKAVVNNDNLEKFGVLVLKTTSKDQGAYKLSVSMQNPGTIDAVDGGTIKSYGRGGTTDTHQDIPALTPEGTTWKAALSTENTFELKNKYDLLTLSMFSDEYYDNFDLAQLKGCYNLKVFTGCVTGNLSSISELTSLTKLNLTRASNSRKLKGDISSLASLLNLTNLGLDRNTALTGSISDLGTLVNLKELAMRDTGVVGAIEEFVAAQIGNGRNNCESLATSAFNTAITFKGSTAYSSGSNKTLSWTRDTSTGATHITLGEDSVDIVVNADGSIVNSIEG